MTPRHSIPARLFACLVIALAVPAMPWAASDPVAALRATADSLLSTGDDDALQRLVSSRPLLVGATVGALLDDAFLASTAGDTTTERSCLALAERMARIHSSAAGSSVPQENIDIYRAWTPAQRDVKAQAQELERQAKIAREFRAFDRAVELLEQAQALYREIGDRRAIALNYGSLGVVHWYRADMTAVRESYDHALEARRAVEDRILEGKTLNGLGSTNLRTGNYDDAIARYQQAIELRRKTGDLGGLGTSLTYLGNCYYQMNRLVDARNYLEEALPILERVGEARFMIEILNSIANLYSDMNRLQAANDAYRRAIDIALGAGAPADEATCRINLASNLRSVGKYSDALDQLEVAAARLEEQPEPFRQADLLRTRAAVWVNIGELDRAREDLLSLLQQAEGLSDPLYWIDAQLMTASVYMALGANDRAQAAAEKTIAAARRHEVVRMEQAGEGMAARIQTRAGDYDAALRHWRAALAISEADESVSGTMEARLGIAGVLALQGKNEDARGMYREHMRLAAGKGLLEYLTVAHQGIAHTFEGENPDSAAFHYDRALEVYEQSLQELGGAAAGTEFLSGNRRYVYEEVARYYTRLYQDGHGERWLGRAFRTVESAKARGLLDQLRQGAAFETSAAEEALLDSLYSAGGGSDAQSAEIRREYERVRAQRVSRSTASFERANAVADLDRVAASLSPGTVMLSYALGDTASLLWVFDDDGAELATLAARGELTTTVSQLRDAIRRPDAGDASLRSAARSLYVALIEPVEDRVKDATCLVIAPDGILFELPFETLLARDADDDDGWDDLDFLGRRVPIVYAPSASVFATLKDAGEETEYDLDLIAFGDPAYDADSGLERLVHSGEEVATISAGVKEERRKVFVGEDASESRLKGLLASTRPRILHLAAHGLIDAADPTASSIALCEPGQSGDDGRLQTLEIATMRLRAALVVLSACESARGRLSRSEGVVGLSRAFLASGADGVVASLWAVSDESTSELMKEMYRRMLGDHEPAAEALRDARVALIKSDEYSHPFHWAPFIAIGTDTSPW